MAQSGLRPSRSKPRAGKRVPRGIGFPADVLTVGRKSSNVFKITGRQSAFRNPRPKIPGTVGRLSCRERLRSEFAFGEFDQNASLQRARTNFLLAAMISHPRPL